MPFGANHHSPTSPSSNRSPFKKALSCIAALALAASMLPASAMHAFASTDPTVDAGTNGDSSADLTAERAENANSWRYAGGELIADTRADTTIDQLAIVEDNGYKEFDGFDTVLKGYCLSIDAYKGIDVSEHQKNVDWQAVKKAGVDFAIIRCGYGMNETAQDDKYWLKNVKGCQAAGIPFGVYIYSYADSVTRASSEADHVLRCLREAGLSPSLDLPVYYDMEDNSTTKADHKELATTFCNKIKAAGYKVGVYANTYWWSTYLTDPVFEGWSRWVAQYNTVGLDYKKFRRESDIWQFTQSGKVNGIEGKVDLNYSHIPTIKRIDYSDVSPHAWYYESVAKAKELNYMSGYAGTQTFGPDDSITRGQAACVLYNMAKQGTAIATSGNQAFRPFKDVDANAYYATAVNWARSTGVVNGYEGANIFDPEAPITREQFACMLWNYAKATKSASINNVDHMAALSKMPDGGQVSNWATEGVGWAVHNKVMGNAGAIYPTVKISRAEAASMVVNHQPTAK